MKDRLSTDSDLNFGKNVPRDPKAGKLWRFWFRGDRFHNPFFIAFGLLKDILFFVVKWAHGELLKYTSRL